MAEIKCPKCKGDKVAVLSSGQYKCAYCGEVFTVDAPAAPAPTAPQPQVVYVQQQAQEGPRYVKVHDRSKIVAALLAFFLGGIGAHHIYLGHAFRGILYLIFCWTFIPSIIAFIEFIIFLCTSEESFDKKYNLRLVQ